MTKQGTSSQELYQKWCTASSRKKTSQPTCVERGQDGQHNPAQVALVVQVSRRAVSTEAKHQPAELQTAPCRQGSWLNFVCKASSAEPHALPINR